MTDAPRIALIGTLDTKGDEIAYVRERLAALPARRPTSAGSRSRARQATTWSGSGPPGAAARRWS